MTEKMIPQTCADCTFFEAVTDAGDIGRCLFRVPVRDGARPETRAGWKCHRWHERGLAIDYSGDNVADRIPG